MNEKKEQNELTNMDPEVQAIHKITEALSSLDNEKARRRVLRWAADRYAGSAKKAIVPLDNPLC